GVGFPILPPQPGREGTADASVGSPILVSTYSTGAALTGGASFVDVSLDGNVVGFGYSGPESAETHTGVHAYVKDRRTGTPRWTHAGAGRDTNETGIGDFALAGNGRAAAFVAAGPGLVPGFSGVGVYHYDLDTSQVTLVSATSSPLVPGPEDVSI